MELLNEENLDSLDMGIDAQSELKEDNESPVKVVRRLSSKGNWKTCFYSFLHFY